MCFRRPPILVLLFALTLRLLAVAALSMPHAAPITYEHGKIAENLLAGKGFSVTFLGVEGLTSQQAPLYPLLLAGCFWVFGGHSPAAILTLQLVQCLVGTGLVWCVFCLARTLSSQRSEVANFAGIIAAVYPPHIYAVTHVQVAIWAALCLTAILTVAASADWKSPWSQPALTGLLAGILLLIDPILLVAFPVVALWLAVKSTPPVDDHAPSQAGGDGMRQVTTQLARPFVMAAVALAIISPWLIRNYRVHHELVFIKSTFGYAFWQGNNAASWGTDKIPKASADVIRNAHDGDWRDQERALWEARHETLYIDDVLLKPAGYVEFMGLNEPARSRLLGQRSCRFIYNEPAAYLRLCGQRLQYFLLFDETNPKAAHWLYRSSTLAWLGLSVVGAAVLRREWRKWLPLFAVFAAVTVFHVLTIVSARFRIPVEPLAFCWGAAGVVLIVERLRDAIAGQVTSPVAIHVAADPYSIQ